MKRLATILAAFTAFSANAAYDYYWFGTAGDGLWTTPANWSSSPTEYVAVANGYPRSTSYIVHVDTSRVPGHHVTIRIPSGISGGCGGFYICDTTDDGWLTIDGEAEGASRPALPLASNFAFTWEQTGHPMKLEFKSLVLPSGSLDVAENECAGCCFVISNCLSTATSNSHYLRLAGQHGGTVAIVDSVVTSQNVNASAPVDVAPHVLAITNSIVHANLTFCFGGPGSVMDVVNSTVSFGSYPPIFGAIGVGSTNEHPNISVRFKNSIFGSANPRGIFAYFFSDNGKLVFDNVTQNGAFNGIELIGFTTWLTNTSFKFCRPNENGYRGIGGDLYLDNSEWVNTNANRYTILNAPLRVTFSGKAPRFGTSYISASAGQPLTLDFLVPVGGYDYPPVNRMDNSYAGSIFPSSVVGGSINVLPESPAARKSETIICPLVYVKDPSAKVCALANLPLTTLPNEKSKFLVTSDYSWEYADVNGKAESDWTMAAPGDNSKVAGVAVKIVGMKPGLSIFVR